MRRINSGKWKTVTLKQVKKKHIKYRSQQKSDKLFIIIFCRNYIIEGKKVEEDVRTFESERNDY